MNMKGDRDDPKALILEAFRIEGIGEAECRSIFLDWALSMPDGADAQRALAALCDRYAVEFPDHPMTRVLLEGRAEAKPAARRGGWRGRRGMSG